MCCDSGGLVKVTRAQEQSRHRWGFDAEATSDPSPGPYLGQVPAVVLLADVISVPRTEGLMMSVSRNQPG